MEILKYPRTHHIRGSRLQTGDDDLSIIPFASIAGKHIVVEEKMDGANSAISFDADGKMLLQSRGHYLTGGAKEKHFDLFKVWAATHREVLKQGLGSRYICYGEWLFAKHTIFYDALPHYWFEFDVYDRDEQRFLSTPRRQAFLQGLPIVSARVLFSGKAKTYRDLSGLIESSLYISNRHIENLKMQAAKCGVSDETAFKETDRNSAMEGLYIKVEEDGMVTARYKLIRESFITAVVDSESHWRDRPVIPNMLLADVNIFAGADR